MIYSNPTTVIEIISIINDQVVEVKAINSTNTFKLQLDFIYDDSNGEEIKEVINKLSKG